MSNLTRWQRPGLEVWPGFGRVFASRGELDRLFEPFASLVEESFLANGWTPAIDLFEDKDNVVVKAELPGLKREDINVSVHEGVLSISGERKTEKETKGEVRRTERFQGQFERAISLPSAVDAAKIQANYKDGILTVTLPKSEQAKPRRIEVNAA